MKKDIENFPYLSKTALANYLDKNPNTLRNSISYWVKNKSLIRLKRGFFVFRNFLEKKDNSLYYSKFLATKIIEPSYLSKESVLQNYQMLTDVVYGYSVITMKKTNFVNNEFGVFNYQSIKKYASTFTYSQPDKIKETKKLAQEAIDKAEKYYVEFLNLQKKNLP